MLNYDQHISTHPHLSFDFSYDSLPAGLWVTLGQCSTKIKLIAETPLVDSTRREIQKLHITRYIQGTVAIEGTELATSQIEEQIEQSDRVKIEYSKGEIANFIKALELISQRASGDEAGRKLTTPFLCELNKLVLRDTPTREGVNIGHLRHGQASVMNYHAPNPTHVAPLVDDFCTWLNSDIWHDHPIIKSGEGSGNMASIIRAIIAHLYFEWIHPFGDGNGRVGRLIELDALACSGIPWFCTPLLTNHYNLNKSQYFSQLDEARHDPFAISLANFLQYAASGLNKGLDEQLKQVSQQNTELIWNDIVRERLGDDNSITIRRQKQLALALGGINKPVPLKMFAELTPQLAVLYAGRQLRTIQRDTNQLEKLGLILRTETGFIANLDAMYQYTPAQKLKN